MTAQASEFVQGTDEWLEARRDGIGSSDAPVIAGERGSVVALWAEKTRQLEPEPPDPDLARLFEWGHRLEPVIADWYSDTTGTPLRRVNRMLVHPSVPYAFASLDRVSARKGERRIIEIKTDRWGRSEGEDIPGAVKAQVQHQLWVTDYEVADVVTLVGGSEPRIIEEARDDDYITDLAFLEADFWHHKETMTPPRADGSENTRRAIARMHPRDDGTILPATDDLRILAEQLRDARIAKKAADEYEGSVSNALRLILGDASGVDGVLTFRKNADSTRVNWPALASAYRTMLEETTPGDILDTLQSIHTSTSEGPRVIRLSKEKP
jgi:putative phage-type endonuclease